MVNEETNQRTNKQTKKGLFLDRFSDTSEEQNIDLKTEKATISRETFSYSPPGTGGTGGVLGFGGVGWPVGGLGFSVEGLDPQFSVRRMSSMAISPCLPPRTAENLTCQVRFLY